MDPCLRVMEKLHDFFNPELWEGHMCPKGPYDKEIASISIQKAIVTVTARDLTYPFAAKSERTASAYLSTAGWGTKCTRTLGISRAAAEVKVPTCTGSCNSGADAEATGMMGSGAMAKDRVIAVDIRETETVAMAEETDAKMETAAGTDVHTGSKGIHPTLPIPQDGQRQKCGHQNHRDRGRLI